MKNIIIFPLLLLIGTFTINPIFGQSSNIDWQQICNTVEFALYNSCDVYVNSFGQLTSEGQRAMGCIINGLGLGGGAALLGTPLEFIIPGLGILAEMTGCGGIVKLDLLNSENPTHLVNMLTQLLSGKGSTNTFPQSDFDQNTLSKNDFSENTIPQQSEFRLFSNELFSIYYPSNWEYEEFSYLGEPNVIFYLKNNLEGDVVLIATYETEDKNLDELILKAKNQQLNYTLSNNAEVQITDISTENIYLGNYLAFKGTIIANSESVPFKKAISYNTIANGKLYAIMLMSPSNDPTEIPVFERMVASFDIFPIGTGEDNKSLEINPNNVDVLYNKGVALDELGRYDEAIQYFKKVLEIDPNHADALKSKNDAVFDALKELDNIDSNNESIN